MGEVVFFVGIEGCEFFLVLFGKYNFFYVSNLSKVFFIIGVVEVFLKEIMKREGVK